MMNIPSIFKSTLAAALALLPGRLEADDRPAPTPPRGPRASALLENALKYVDPKNQLIDPVSGYPREGWNQDPARGLFLRSFTQLTAIGQWLELLAGVAAGQVEAPGLSRDAALAQLQLAVKSLRKDQDDPTLAAKGLLGNFLDLATGKRLGPLASDIEKSALRKAFPGEGDALWNALQQVGWITPRNRDTEANITRNGKYGSEYFEGPLLPFADPARKAKVMSLLDERVVMIVFGDNANLSASVAKTIGTLLDPSIQGRPEAVALRADLESFLNAQRDGYLYLYDTKSGLFTFGWNASRDRLIGWEDLQGKPVIGHMDYLVNEFRGPATFVATRFGIPTEAIANLGFKMKSYVKTDGVELFALAPWEGSAFQALGLGLSLGEASRPGWSELLANVVAIEADFAGRKGLPGFLSESYTGDGTQYTGTVGIPDIAVSPRPRITDAASLYTLGTAHAIAPGLVDALLDRHWETIATLFTDHGPWEGYNIASRAPIPFQTTAHTLALILGLVGHGSENMKRYLDHQGLSPRLEAYFGVGKPLDLMRSRGLKAFSWSDPKDVIESAFGPDGFEATSAGVHLFGVAFVAERPEGFNLSGGRLTIRYRSKGGINPAIVALKSKSVPEMEAMGLISNEIFTKLRDTGDGDAELVIPLPATPGLTRIKEVVITHEPGAQARPVDLKITGLRFDPANAR